MKAIVDWVSVSVCVRIASGKGFLLYKLRFLQMSVQVD